MKRLAIPLYVLFLLVLLELASYVAGRVLQDRWLMYRDPVAPEGKAPMSYQEYLEVRNPELGWPRAEEFGQEGYGYDADGARRCLESGVADSAPWTLSFYGDSYTLDRIGGDTDHWVCRLQRLLGARARNYGVSGYGTDQALMRYLGNRDDRARVVVLAHMSEDILRNLTRYRDFQTYSQDWAFKPRFELDESGGLRRLPLPAIAPADYPRFIGIEQPQLVLPGESFQPNGEAGAVRLTFPFTLALVRNMGFWRLQSWRADVPAYAPFYGEDHPLHGLQITTRIMLRFVREAQARGQQALLILFPGPSDMEYQREHHRWVYQPLIDALRREGVEPLNFGETLVADLGDRPVSQAFGTGSPSRQAHYSLETSHRVAEVVLERLVASGLVAPPDAPTQR